jgi:hypothetical protein
MLLGKHVFTKGKEERMRLLLVEDEEDLIQAMARGLRQEGYAVDLALDGLRGWGSTGREPNIVSPAPIPSTRKKNGTRSLDCLVQHTAELGDWISR